MSRHERRKRSLPLDSAPRAPPCVGCSACAEEVGTEEGKLYGLKSWKRGSFTPPGGAPGRRDGQGPRPSLCVAAHTLSAGRIVTVSQQPLTQRTAAASLPCRARPAGTPWLASGGMDRRRFLLLLAAGLAGAAVAHSAEQLPVAAAAASRPARGPAPR